MAAVHNGAGLLASRFFLGITEAGLFPGVIYYLTLWYTRAEQASRLAFFFGCSTVAGVSSNFTPHLEHGLMMIGSLIGFWRCIGNWWEICVIEQRWLSCAFAIGVRYYANGRSPGTSRLAMDFHYRGASHDPLCIHNLLCASRLSRVQEQV